MAVGYLKENFAFGTLASTLAAAAVTLTMTAGHSLPTAAGTFQLVIWDSVTYPNASDDPNVEIVAASFDTGNAYDITRAQESTSDVEHAAGQKVGLHYTAAVNVDDLDAANHPMARVTGSTFSTVQHMQDIFHSAGWISGGAVTDDGDGTITVAAGTGLIRATDSATVQMLYFDWAAESGANVALVDNDISYVYVEYNAGSPQVVATITKRTDFNTNVLLASVSREGTDVHINQTDQHTVGDHANSMIRRMVGVQPYGHVSGGILSETGTRNIAVTAGDFWRGLTEFTTSAVDTSGAPTFSYYYNDGSWQKVASVSDIHQTNYNNFGVGLATLSNNRYSVHWVYIEADDDDLAVVYGIGDYTLSQAEDAQPPSAIPQHLQMEGILAGKIIIKKSDAAFTQVESAFQTKFTGSLATDHANLVSLDFASAAHTGFLASDGSVALAGAWDMGSQALTNVNIDSGVITGITDLAIADGGTGQGTAQAAIDALSAVSAATNEHVLTKDTGTGNAIWKAAAGGVDVKAGIDAAATADYVGAASSDGFLRTGAGLTYTDGGNFITLSPDLVGDATAGRVIRFARLIIQDGTNANTLKCDLLSTWNGDTITIVDNIAKGATTSGWTLNAGGTVLTIEASGLTGNAVAVLGTFRSNSSGDDTLQADFTVASNDILLSLFQDGSEQDLTVLTDTGAMSFNIIYVTDA